MPGTGQNGIHSTIGAIASHAADDGRARALSATVDLAPIGIAHFDASGHFLLVNAWLCAILGYTCEELLQLTFQEITHPDDVAECLALQYELAANRMPAYSLEKRFVRRDGTAVWTRVSVSAVRDIEGRPEFFIGIAEDISERRANEELFRMLANGITQLAWIASSDGARHWFNERWYEYTGTSLEQVRGKGWHAVVHPDHLQRVSEGQIACFRAGTIWEDTVPLRGSDGGYRWFLSRAVPVKDESGRIVHWLGTNTDITNLREAHQEVCVARSEAESAMLMRDELLAVVAHDLNNPLNSIATAALTLRSHKLAPEQQERVLDLIQRTVRSMARLIGDLQDAARLKTRMLVLARGPLDPSVLLAETCEWFEGQAKARNITLACDLQPDLPYIFGDRTRLERVLANLLGNALKFTPGGGHVSLRAKYEDGSLHVSVQDDGPGIPEELQPRLFERFWQANRSAGVGSGLGLVICKEIVEAHGGHIWIDTKPGHGTTVHFAIPVASGATAPAA